MAILKQNEVGASVPDLSREHGISSASVYKWRAKFSGMDASLMITPALVQTLEMKLKSRLCNPPVN
jgi:putative transposase